MPCKQNHYCQGGLRFQCPAERPVTQAMGAATLDECMTCVERDGSGKPVFDDLMGTDGDCVSCVEYNSETPIWDGNACVACASGTAWNTDKNACVATIPQATECTADEDCVYKIPHGDSTLYLVESAANAYTATGAHEQQSVSEIYTADDTYFGYILNTDEDATFLAKYGIVNKSSYYRDYWAGAMKYCQDKGLRLPTMDELVSIMNVVYGVKKEATSSCTVANAQYVGEQKGCQYYSGLTVANQALRNFLGSGSSETSVTSTLYLWSSAEYSLHNAYSRDFYPSYSHSGYFTRSNYNSRALCVR